MPTILQVHNKYLRHGGEDSVLLNENRLLSEAGYEVVQHLASNEDLPAQSKLGLALSGLSTTWSATEKRRMENSAKENRPFVAHIHNTFPLMSPSVYYGLQRARTPVVQTLHNYRLTCSNGLLLRNARPCELCVDGSLGHALRYRCYRDSVLATSAVVTMQAVHHAVGTYRHRVHVYIALSNFARSIMVRCGLPEERIIVKPNFIYDIPEVEQVQKTETYAFLGRVSEEKGVDLLIDAWQKAKLTGKKLQIIGDGPMRAGLEARTKSDRSIEWLGWKQEKEVRQLVAGCKFLVISSRCYELGPIVLLEAMACATPVIGPRHAAFPEVVEGGRLGMLYTPNDPEALAQTLVQSAQMSPEQYGELSRSSRQTYLQKYTPEVNLKLTLDVYAEARARAAAEYGNLD